MRDLSRAPEDAWPDRKRTQLRLSKPLLHYVGPTRDRSWLEPATSCCVRIHLPGAMPLYEKSTNMCTKVMGCVVTCC